MEKLKNAKRKKKEQLVISKYYQKYMKVKLLDIMLTKDALQNLLNTKLPIKTSYKLNKLAIALNVEYEAYEKQRVELVKEYGEEKEDGSVAIPPDSPKMKEFLEKIAELQNIEVSLDFEKLKVEELGDIEIEPTNLPLWILE